MAKAPPPRKPDQEEGTGRIVIKVDGVEYPLRVDEITAADAGALRQSTGLSVRAVTQAAEVDPDIDIIAALVFLSRRQNGAKSLAYAAVADAISYRSTIETDTLEDDGVEDDLDPQL